MTAIAFRSEGQHLLPGRIQSQDSKSEAEADRTMNRGLVGFLVFFALSFLWLLSSGYVVVQPGEIAVIVTLVRRAVLPSRRRGHARLPPRAVRPPAHATHSLSLVSLYSGPRGPVRAGAALPDALRVNGAHPVHQAAAGERAQHGPDEGGPVGVPGRGPVSFLDSTLGSHMYCD